MKDRVKFISIVLIVVFALLFSRLFFLQILMGGYYRTLASGNRLQRVEMRAVRGAILDRNGEVLAGNREKDGNMVRFYPEGEIVAGITGYVSDMVGMTGLEKEYDESLSGVSGEKLVEYDANGKEVKTVAKRESINGRDLKLNIDIGLQRAAYGVLKQRLADGGNPSVSAVVARVNGQVLSIISLPSYDPNLFSKSDLRGTAGGEYASVEKVLSDENRKPLFNRAVSGVFPPGSVYKLVPATAGINEGVVDENTTYEDTGEIKIGQFRFGNWLFDRNGGTEGQVDIRKALARSNDIYFYRLGEALGVDKLVSWSAKMGVGRKTGIDLPGEAEGLLPDPLWRERTIGERWFLGNTYHMSIGQGDLLMTPLQINRITAAAISGEKCKPRLFGRDGDCEELGIPENNRRVIVQGMRMACMQGGTAYPLFDLNGRVVCKTGTAQHGGEEHKSHAWISVVIPTKPDVKSQEQFADVDDWIVTTIMVEEAGEGSAEAGPLARKFADYILKQILNEDEGLPR